MKKARHWVADNLAKDGKGGRDDFILEGRRGYFQIALCC